ncbi:hypothetical protein MTO96_012986 [Rhipicephalus appendiculatus]
MHHREVGRNETHSPTREHFRRETIRHDDCGIRVLRNVDTSRGMMPRPPTRARHAALLHDTLGEWIYCSVGRRSYRVTAPHVTVEACARKSTIPATNTQDEHVPLTDSHNKGIQSV